MAIGHERERQVLESLAASFELQTDGTWDEEYKIDAVIIRPLLPFPLFPSPIPLQLTTKLGNWEKRAATFRAVSACAARLAFIEMSGAITPLLVQGLITALRGLFFDAGAPAYALIEIRANGRYEISDLAARLELFQQSLSHKMPGDLNGRVTYWKEGSGFIEVEVVGSNGQRETITFYAPMVSVTDPELTAQLAQFTGSISDPRLQPHVLLNDGGINRRRDSRKFALNVRLASIPAGDELELQPPDTDPLRVLEES